MAGRLIGLHILVIIIIIIFFLVTLGSSIFFTMVFFSSRVSGEQAGNLMVLALVPPSILTVIFLNKVAGKLYDRLSGSIIKSSQKKWLRKIHFICVNHHLEVLSNACSLWWYFSWMPREGGITHPQWPESIKSLRACITFSAMPSCFGMTTPSYFKRYFQICC